MTRFRALLAVGAIVGSVTLAGCGDVTPTPPKINAVQVDGWIGARWSDVNGVRRDAKTTRCLATGFYTARCVLAFDLFPKGRLLVLSLEVNCSSGTSNEADCVWTQPRNDLGHTIRWTKS